MQRERAGGYGCCDCCGCRMSGGVGKVLLQSCCLPAPDASFHIHCDRSDRPLEAAHHHVSFSELSVSCVVG